MHRLLMERGDIIDPLIAVKHKPGTGSAFRPAGSGMMRRLWERHRFILPLDTVREYLARHHLHVHLSFSRPTLCMRRVSRRSRNARFRPLHFGSPRPLSSYRGRGGCGGCETRRKVIWALCLRSPARAPGGRCWKRKMHRKFIARVFRSLNARTIPPLARIRPFRPAADASLPMSRLEPPSLRLEPRRRAAVARLPRQSPCPTARSTALPCWVSLPQAQMLDSVTDALVKAGASGTLLNPRRQSRNPL